MLRLFTALIAIVVGCFVVAEGFAGPKKSRGGPPGLAKKGGVPPGLAKKRRAPPGLTKKGGVPPGIAKKYNVGERLPSNRFQLLDPRLQRRLPYITPDGRKWVRVERDLYLLNEATGTIVDVVQGWIK